MIKHPYCKEGPLLGRPVPSQYLIYMLSAVEAVLKIYNFTAKF